MNFHPFYALFNIMIPMLLNRFLQLKAMPIIIDCSPGTSHPIEGKSLSEIFADASKLRDVEALKYFCINDLIESTIRTEMVNLLYMRLIQFYTFSFMQPNLLKVSYNVSDSSWKSLNENLTVNITTTICKNYTEIKAFEYKLQKFINAQNTSNATVVAIMYLLQSAAESLQAIQVSCSYVRIAINC